MPFGVSVGEDLIFKVSLALLSFLSLLLMFILVVILWLKKIRRQVDKTTKALKLMANNSWPQMNNAYVYSAGDLNEDGTHLRQTSFGCSEDQENEEILTNGSNAEPGEPCPESGQRKLYQSIKSPTNGNYAKLHEDSEKTVCTAAAEDFVLKNKNTYSKPEAIIAPQYTLEQTDTTDKDYVVMIGEDEGTSVKCLSDSAHNGMNSHILENGDDASQNEYENEYLAVIHTDETSRLPVEVPKTKMPHQEDESEYLVPIETPTLKGQRKQERKSDAHSERKHVTSGVLERKALLDNSRAHENDKPRTEYESMDGVGIQQSEQHSRAQFNSSGVSKSAKKDDHEYLTVKDVGKTINKASPKVPVRQPKKDGIAANASPLKPNDGDEESYDYITTRQGKEWTVSSGNASKPQEWNVSSGNVSKLQDHNPSSSEEAHYINKDTTVHVIGESTASSNEDNNEYIMVVHERESDPESHAGEEANASGKAGPQNATDQIYENFNVVAENNDHLEGSASAQSQHDTKPTSNTQNSVAGFCDDSHIYDNPDLAMTTECVSELRQ